MSFGPLLSAKELLSVKDAVILIDARPGADAYASGHLENAIHADLNVHLSAASEPGFDPSHGGRHPLPSPAKWAAQLSAWGITPSARVVIYDAASGSNAATRAWWMLRAGGHEHVAVLDGGIQAAVDTGFILTKKPTQVHAVSSTYPVAKWMLPTVTIEQVDALRKDASQKLLDVRSRERWRGEVEPIDPVAGRIEGSVNLPFTENLDARGFWKSPAELRVMYDGLLGGMDASRLAVHCGSGVTACHTLFALELAGFGGASLYVGSFSEWCRQKKLTRL